MRLHTTDLNSGDLGDAGGWDLGSVQLERGAHYWRSHHLGVLRRSRDSLHRVDGTCWTSNQDLLLGSVLARPYHDLLAGQAGQLLGGEPDLALLGVGNIAAEVVGKVVGQVVGWPHHQWLLDARPKER